MIEWPDRIPPDTWDISAPDGDGFVWLRVDKGDGSFTMFNLGTAPEVFEKLAEWCSLHDPE